MIKQTALSLAVALMSLCPAANAQAMIGKSNIQLKNNLLTPEALWAMGRISSAKASPDGKKIVYQVGYYSIQENKGQQVIYIANADGSDKKQLTTSANSETDPCWINNGTQIAFLSKGQIWSMDLNGANRKQLTNSKAGIEGFKFSPDGKQVLLAKSIKFNEIIQENPSDLPKATGRRITDLMYRHWDHYVESILHPFLAQVTESGIDEGYDILENEPFECPMEPFGGMEQLAWSQDSKKIAYTCRKKIGKEYSISTDSDIFLYDIATKQTTNLCKPADYKPLSTEATKTFKHQAVNRQKGDFNVGYDTNPQFSPDGKYIAWQSREKDGCESDRNRLCLYNLATGKKTYITESFDSDVDEFCWNHDSQKLYFMGVWHACINIYQTDLNGKVMQLTDGWHDFSSLQMMGKTNNLLTSRRSISHPDELFVVAPVKKALKSEMKQITNENKHIFDQLEMGKVQQRWVSTVDGKKELVWIILPPNFDENKKYPTILYCQGGPQSPVSQFWSYRWNFQLMAANGYVIVAPNRRGLPGFGSEWNDQISGDWAGLCISDYLSAIDDAVANLPFVDKDRLGCIGASFGGYSAYYLAGHHNKRFKAFISHNGAFNLEAMYTETEENWFSNWEYESAYWNKELSENAKRTYDNSPHKFVDKWDTPILCIVGEKDYRIAYTQGIAAFNAARMQGVPAELLMFPDENHWVLKPQNAILWQRTFFNWLDKWLK